MVESNTDVPLDTHRTPISYAIWKLRTWWATNKYAIGASLLILAIWQFYSSFISRGDFYFPSPDYAIRQTIANSNVVLDGLATTTTAMLGGFVLAVLLGIPLGILFGEVFVIRQAALPSIVYIYSLPQAIVAPLFILWFGTNIWGIIVFVGIFSMFPILINSITGFTQIDREYQMLAETAGFSHWQRIKKIQFWFAVPNIVAGIKIAVQSAVVSTIIIEFIATSNGLGFLLSTASGTGRTGMMFGIIFLIGTFALILFKVVELLIQSFLRSMHLA
jgi:NitT/TauT family transport system permease protein